MTSRIWLSALLILLSASAARAASSALPTYHVVRKISLPGAEGWDYQSVDYATHRLFISRSTHVQVVDLNTGKLVGEIPDTAGVHGIAFDDKIGRGFTSNGRSSSVTIFNLKTLQKIGEVPVGQGPDCIIFDPATERVFTFNGRGQSATAIDARSGKVAGTVTLPGRPEFAVSDGKGTIYDNIEDKSEIVKIDAQTLRVAAEWPLAPGEGPSGLAIDPKSRRLFSVCDNQKMPIIDADTGRLIEEVSIGNGPDAAAFDAKYNIAFSPNGEDGTLTEVYQDSPNRYTVIATLPTQRGARTMALDSRTHHIYTVTATQQPPPPGTEGQRFRRSYAPGSFVVLELAP